MTPLRGFLLFMPATLVILGAPEATEARHYASSTLLRVETDSVAPKVDPPSGGLKIPNAALERINWGDLDGWVGDDHASAFATFYASCRPIMRASLLRVETLIPADRNRPVQHDARKRSSNRQTELPVHPQSATETRRARTGMCPRRQGWAA